MNRYVLIAIAVFVPFCALVAWGLLSTKEAAPEVVVVQASPPAPVTPVPVVVAPAPVLAAPVAVAPPTAVAAPIAPAPPGPQAAAEPSGPPEADNADADARRAVIEQLTPLVEPCLANQPAKNRILTGFIVNPDGSLGDVKVKARSRGKDLAGCVKGVLEHAHVDPAKGVPQAPMRHAFAASGH